MDASELHQTSNKKVMSHTHTHFNRVSVFLFIEGMFIHMYGSGLIQLWIVGSGAVHVQSRNGSVVVHIWFNDVSGVVQVWFTFGSVLVQVCCRFGSG